MITTTMAAVTPATTTASSECVRGWAFYVEKEKFKFKKWFTEIKKILFKVV